MRGSGNFRQRGGRGGGVQVNLTKKALTFLFCFLFVCFLKSSAYFTEAKSQMVNFNFKENYHFSRFLRGSNFFPGGGGGGGGSNSFQGGSNCLFPIETHIICDFQGGGGSGSPAPPPPWIRQHITLGYAFGVIKNTV